MRTIVRFLIFSALMLLAINTFAQSTEFTYLGSLQNNGQPANGNHDFEYALFDLQMAAKLLRPGGVIVMDNAEQTGPYQASRTFLARHAAWRELGNAVASYDALNPFDATRASVPGTTFILLQAPDHVAGRHAPRAVDRFLDLGQERLDASP